jgi:hypothetical protein
MWWAQPLQWRPTRKKHPAFSSVTLKKSVRRWVSIHAKPDPHVASQYVRPHLPLRPGNCRKEKSSGPASGLNRPFVEFIIDLSAFYSTP